jgi:hypothetical protein
MPVPLIIPIETIRARMNFDEGDEAIETVMISAVQGMVPGLGAMLQTDLVSGSTSEVFCVDPDGPSYGGTYRLWLRNGFVKNVVMTSGDTLREISDDETPLKVEAERGVVVIPGDIVGRWPRYVRVTYDYGFVKSDPTMPAWLTELCLVYSVQLMSMHQMNDPKAETNGILKSIGEHSQVIVEGKFRADPRAIRSIM